MKIKIIIIIAFTVSFWSCKKDYNVETEIGRIESSDVVYLGDEYVEVYLRNTDLVNKGICYSEEDSLPTINNHVSFITHWSYDGSYMVKLGNLKEGYTYYCRVFIQKGNAVVYGSVRSFTMSRTPTGWVQKMNFPGQKRYCAVGFSIGNKGYIGTGNAKGNKIYKDFWEYDPAASSWTRKADIPGGARFCAVGFAIGNKGYIGTGYYNTGQYFQDFWEFKP